MQPKERLGTEKEPAARGYSAAAPNGDAPGPRASRPLLMVDIDGVISLFAGALDTAAEGAFHSIEGIPHFLSATAAAHLLALGDQFELIWASGWEDRAEDHLPHLLGLPAGLPFLRFERDAPRPAPSAARVTRGHWKLDAIEAFAGDRPLAWIDDALDDACREWAASRPAPTLLVQTDPSRGLTAVEAELLSRWALSLAAS
jgi:HAD domain in Swiss Army Knife RNA repair proteins